MKASIRILALILAILTLLPLAMSCKKKQDGGDDTVATTASTEEGVPSSLPAKDWDGKDFNILGRDSPSFYPFTTFEVLPLETSGDVINEAVYNRNELLRMKYNFNVVGKNMENPHSEAQRLFGANEHVYDMIMYRPYQAVPAASGGYLLDFSTMQYVDLDHPSWNSYVNEQLAFGGKLFFTTNDFTLMDKYRTYCLFYNREMARDKHLMEEGEYFEDIYVDTGKWTLAKFTELAVAVKSDTGEMQGSVDAGDTFGVTTESYYSFGAFLIGAGFRVSKMGDDNYPVFISKASGVERIDEVMKFWGKPDVAASVEDIVVNGSINYGFSTATFIDERALFVSGFPSSYDSSLGSGCEFEFSVLPFPKYNEKQKNYYTYANGNASVIGVPFTADEESVGFFVQALAEESTETTLRTFIDTKCKLQDSYDERCAKMLDIIFDGVVYDTVLFCDFGKMETLIYSEIPKARKNYYTRYYDKYAKNAKYEMDQLLEKYQDM